ncbi:MAG: hypothetical protein IJ874_07235 [Ruminococcus sp.]|nr:hypothetical protein [Ruminococcus sp.]
MRTAPRFAAAMLAAALCSGLWGCTDSTGNAEKIIGSWYSDDIGSAFCFREDGRLYLQTDISDTMTFDGQGVAHMTGSDMDYSSYCSYDGSTLSFVIEDTVEMLTISRRGEPDPDSAYGEYDVTGGIMLDTFSEEFGGAEGRYGVVLSEGSFVAEVDMCSYTISENGKKMTLSGEELSVFGTGSGDTVYDISFSGDKLRLESSGKKLEFTRNAGQDD